MKVKIVIGMLIGLIGIAIALLIPRQSQEQIQIVGELSQQEIAQVRSAVRRVMHPPLLRDFSFASLRTAPGLLLDRVRVPSPKIWRIEARTPEFVAVIARLPLSTNSESYVFYSVFRGTNKWWAGSAYRLSNYRP